MRRVRLCDIAEIKKSNKGEIYPKGSILFGVSASKSSDIFYLKEDSEVGEKFAVAQIDEKYNSFYVFNAIFKIYKQWFEVHKQNINLPFDELKNLKFEIETDRKKQDKIAQKLMQLEKMIEKEEKTIEIFKNIKKVMLRDMFI